MEKLIAVLCVLVLAVTATDGVMRVTIEDPEKEKGAQEGEMSTIMSVTVPERKIGEAVQYDHFIKIESKWENESSGDYWFWALDVWGTHTITLVGTTTKSDGFGEQHSVLRELRQLAATFTVYSDSSDGEEIQATGKYDIQRDEFIDLNENKDERKIILTESDAWLKVDELPSTTIPLEFTGYMRSYFDVLEEKTETLEDSVLDDDRYIEVGDTGDYDYKYDFGSGVWEIPYTWKAEHGLVTSGYETIFINVTSDLGDENFSIPFQEKLWYANEVSVAVRQYINTSTFFDGENESFYLIIENDFILQKGKGGYTPGEQDIPWGLCNDVEHVHWHFEHLDAEMDSWRENYMPKSGSDFDESSFDFRTEDAIDYLTTEDPITGEYPSQGLKDFLDDYSNAMVTNADYTADPLTDEYWWNLTFGRERADGENRSVKGRYQLLVKQETELLPPPAHNVYTVEEDYGLKNGSSSLDPYEVSSQVVTLASGEDLLRTDDKVIELFYTTAGQETEELNWVDIKGIGYGLQTMGWQQFGMDMIATLTGIEIQTTAKYYWQLEKEDLAEGGTYAGASIDAETGRLISVLSIKGTALQGAFRD